MRRRFARVSLTAVCAAGTVSTLDFPRNYPCISIFFALDGKFPGGGDY